MSRCSGCAATLPEGARFCPSCGCPADVGSSDERRIITVLFADIVGSTTLAEGLDPEDWKALRDEVLDDWAGIVDREGGRVAQLLGDGLLAFFGAPTAHEDDPLRAVRAGLAITGSGERGGPQWSPPGTQPAVRVGITTGEVVVGSVGRQRHGEYLATGDAVNVAARLQAEARPRSVLVSDETYRLAGPSVEATSRGSLTLKGRSDPVEAWEIHAVRAGRRRAGRRAAFLGRDADLTQLRGIARRMTAGTGAAVTVTGEAGIGKSRLIEEWRAALPPATRWREASCQTNGRSVAYGLAIDCVRSLLGLGAGDSGDSRPRLRDAAARLEAFPDAEALLQRLLWLSEADPEGVLAGLDNRALHDRTRRVLRALVENLALEAPLIIALEDVHWIDPSSAELVAAWLPLVASCPLTICMTSRQPVRGAPGALGAALSEVPRTAVVEVGLGPLSASDQRRLVAGLTEPSRAMPGISAAVLERSGGNPLFVEELVAMMVASTGSRAALGVGSDEPTIPRTLRSLLLERIDLLPVSARELARIGSVIGQTFGMRLAGDVACRTGHEAIFPADVLARSDGLLERAAGDGELVVFRHALVREAAYASLARSDRRRLHLAVAEALEADAAPGVPDSQRAPQLARHFQLGGADEPALRYARAGAEAAAGTFANTEAIDLYDIAIDAGRRLLQSAHGPDVVTRRRSDLASVLEARAWLVRLAGRYPEAEQGFREAFDLLPPEPSVLRARSLRILATCASDRKAFDEERRTHLEAEAVLEEVRSEDDPRWWTEWIDLRAARADLAYWLGWTDELETLLGSLADPVRTHGTAKQVADFEGLIVEYLHRRDQYLPSPEVVAHARAGLEAHLRHGDRGDIAWAHFHVGFALLWNLELAESELELRLALAEAEHMGSRLLVARAATYLSIDLRRLRRMSEVSEMADRVIDVARELGIDQYVAIGLANRAWAALAAGDPHAASVDAAAAASTWPAEPAYLFRWLDLWPAIAADVALGRPRDALPRCRLLLDPTQQPQADAVREAIEAVLSCADAGGDPQPLLERAISLAEAERYL